MSRGDMTLKCVAYGLALAAVAVLNYTLFVSLPLPVPLLLPMLAVAAGTLEGPGFGGGLGAAAGLLMSAAGHAPLWAIPLLALLGWAAGVLARQVLRRDLIGHLVCAAGAMLLWELWQVGSRLVRGVAGARVLLQTAWPELLWTMVLSLPVYALARFCCVHYGRIYHE